MDSPVARTRWYAGLTAGHWLILAVASAGWVFDVYEGQLFTIFKTPMLADLTGGNAAAIDEQANQGFAAFLFGGAVGGLIFGILGDRFGRLRIMAVTILIYSMFSALTALAHTPGEVNVLRFLVALGTGGEWAVAAALVAETFPVRARAAAGGIFHASSVIGVGLASLTGLFFARLHYSWRAGFVVGLLPALLVVWMRLALRDRSAPVDLADDALELPERPARGSLAELLGNPEWRTRALLGLALSTVGLATYWGIFAWGPDLAALALGGSAQPDRKQEASSLAYLVMNFTGGLAGLLSFAPLADRLGRRGAFACYHVGAAILVPVTYLGAHDYATTLCLLSVMAFFVLGMHAGYAIYFPELFPTRHRATGASVCFNLGRVLGAVALLIRGRLGARFGLPVAATMISCLFWIGLIFVYFAPETRGTRLPD